MKDPDITAPYLFLLGKIIPEKWGKKRMGFMPYKLQHLYFFMSKFFLITTCTCMMIFNTNSSPSWPSITPAYLLSH